ncbi:uncharacterized protein LY89DRAFT_666276 [Mollisia scopiformis]|uniref:HMG box domain-containing protein n=1 Tax=Mollisia scopiformis TaxID=149040 RepID=A0A194XKE8_MOLSC|nr:uncharacterized protein LY89DRAFT_666276 [Mollisia scopiformis]KUJ20616.1 hypothetical protein LY89DRAFT_666276 [Mollisia scopiformis]
MLSIIGRAAVKRVVAGGPQSTNRALQSIWQLQRVPVPESADNAPSRSQVLFLYKRSYATTTVTKARAARSPRSTTTAKPKTKAAPKKAVKKPAKKPAKKAKPALRKAKKPVKKPVKRKVLTEKQKELAVIKDLRAKALSIPTMKPPSAWQVFTADQSKTSGAPLTERMSAFGQQYKSLSPAELESLNHIANENKETNAVQYKQWVESHTPDQIRIANNARKLLKKKYNKKHLATIVDSRQPKRPANARAMFVKDRYDSGDFKGIKFAEASKLVQSEWSALSPSERKVYEDSGKSNVNRYVQEYKTVYHRDSRAQIPK